MLEGALLSSGLTRDTGAGKRNRAHAIFICCLDKSSFHAWQVHQEQMLHEAVPGRRFLQKSHRNLLVPGFFWLKKASGAGRSESYVSWDIPHRLWASAVRAGPATQETFGNVTPPMPLIPNSNSGTATRDQPCQRGQERDRSLSSILLSLAYLQRKPVA